MVVNSLNYLHEMVAAQHAGSAGGIPSVCSAHPFVLEACLRLGLDDNTPVLIESTCNQVNQFGGYTGMSPADFRAYLAGIAARVGYPFERVILGGDHLGPNVWQAEPAAAAMDKSLVLVGSYVRAGYRKIHLDASMKCGDDDPGIPLPKSVSAARSAAMAAAAEAAFEGNGLQGPPPVYVIGTEVPIPGGSQEAEDSLHVTSPDDLGETIEETHRAFIRQNLHAAWERVIAVVAQPGVEFGDAQVHFYAPDAAAALSESILAYPGLVFEGHSTDYQPRSLLRRLVEDHFAILKVGPGLTFAFREAVFALEHIEKHLVDRDRVQPAGLSEAIETAMLKNPAHWKKYYHGSAAEIAFARRFSLSDRIRYYWSVPEVEQAFRKLLENLNGKEIPLTLLSQYMPLEYEAVRLGRARNRPADLIIARIRAVFADYQAACFGT